MKVLDLSCAFGHVFEGWFASENDFQTQLSRGLVQCPVCENAHITKQLSAPRLNLSGTRDPAHSDGAPNHQSPAESSTQAQSPDSHGRRALNQTKNSAAPERALMALMQDPDVQAAYLRAAKEVLAKTEDVGDQFAHEARKIHHGESDPRGIRGQATAEQVEELAEEGIDVLPLLLPTAFKQPLQ